MAQPGNFTPILLYGSSTPGNAPVAANLTNNTVGSEIAINVADKNLFFKDSGGVVNTVPIRQSSTSSNGWLSSTDWNTFNNKTSNLGTVTSVAALTLGTTGTDLSSTVANSTTTPVITLNVPTASATNRGALSAADWSTFNGKQAALVSGTNIKTVGGVSLLGAGDVGTIGIAYGGTGQTSFTAGQIHYGSFSTSTNLFYDSANVRLGVGTSSPSKTLDVNGAANINGGLTIAGNLIVPSGVTMYSTSGDVYFRAGTSGNLYLGAGGSNSLATIFASGGVSIGNTTDPGAAWLSVTNGIRINTTGVVYGAGEYLSINAATSQFGVGIVSNTTTGASLAIWNKNTVQPYFLTFAQGVSGLPCGSISFNGALTVYATTSDQRLKTDIGVATDTSVIDNTIIHDFTWANGVVDKGVFAQEAYKVKPTAVQVGNDNLSKNGELLKPWGVDYSAYVPDLIVKCQQQDKVIEALLQRITALEQR